MNQIYTGKNTGVIITPPSDFEVGAAFPIPSILNNNSDWRPYECDGEWQKDMQIDWESEACMSFTPENNIATYLNWLIQTGQMPQTHLDFLRENGFIGEDGKVALSGRFLATMDGTTINGNNFQNPWDTAQTIGMVADSVWSMPVAAMNADPANAWKLYYTKPTAEVIALGQKFLTYFQIDWRWLVSNGNGATQAQFVEWLKVAPIHIAIAVCGDWNNDNPIQGCGTGAAHGVQLSYVEVGRNDSILDHYAPFQKNLASNYTLAYAAQGICTPKALPEAQNAPIEAVVSQVPNLVSEIQTLPVAQQSYWYSQIVEILVGISSLFTKKSGSITLMNTNGTLGYAVAILEIVFAGIGFVMGWMSPAEAMTVFTLGLSTLGIHTHNVAVAQAMGVK